MHNSTRFTVFRLNQIDQPAEPPIQLAAQSQSDSEVQPDKPKGPGRVLREPQGDELLIDEPADRVVLTDFLLDVSSPVEVEPVTPPVPISEDQKYHRVRVYFATDRARLIALPSDETFEQWVSPNKAFGNDRSDGSISLGLCIVAIPNVHRIGEIEKPNIFRLEFKENPIKHVVILELKEMREAYFLESVEMIAGKSGQSALVFIHGYNVTFAEAVRRTAQLAFDLDFHGVPICYSWPSTGKYSGYMADEATIEWTIPHLMEFLGKIANLKNLKSIHLIAHSMGNRALVNSLARIVQRARQKGKSKPRFDQTILAAPDIDADVFRQLAQSFYRATTRTTLYASSGDLALQVSQQFHHYPRAGDSGSTIVVVPQVDTVDVSDLPIGLLGHSYYGGSRSVLTDIYQLVKSGAPPPRFGLRQSEGVGGIYWTFVP